VFKKNSIHKLTYTGGDLPFERTEIEMRVWGIAGFTVAKVPQGLLFLNEEGLQYTDGTKVENLSSAKKIDGILSRQTSQTPFLGAIETEKLTDAFAVSDDTRQEYHIILPLSSGNQMLYLLTWNWQHDTWKIRNAGIDNPMSCLGVFSDSNAPDNTEGNKRLMIGRHNLTLKYETETYDISGSDYDSYHTTPWLDFGSPGKYKEIIKVQPLWRGIITGTITVSYRNETTIGYTDLSAYTFVSNQTFEEPILPMRALGRRFQFRISGTTANVSFFVYSMKIFYNERDIR
jgi:hypothetical protein